jgi:hypothetical protein
LGTDIRQLFRNAAIPTGKAGGCSIVRECDRTGRTTRYPATVSTNQRSGIPFSIEEQQNLSLALECFPHGRTEALAQEGSSRFGAEINQLNIGLEGHVPLHVMNLSFNSEIRF